MDDQNRAVPDPEGDGGETHAPPAGRRGLRRAGVRGAGRRRGRGERGAVLVEMAIILPVLMTIVLGIVEYSLAFKDSLSVTSATRAGARTASAQPRTTTFASDTAASVARAMTAIDNAAPQVLWIYRADVNGLPDNGSFSGTCTVCVRYVWDAALPGGGGWSLVSDGWPPASQNACAGTAQAVGVYVRARHEYLTRLFGSGVTVEDHTVMRLEPIPTSAQCAP